MERGVGSIGVCSSIQRDNENNYVNLNLTPNTQYSFTVKARSSQRDGNTSALTVTTLADLKQISITAVSGKTNMVALTCENISSFVNVTFKVVYDPTVLSLIDFAAQTPAADTAVAVISGSDVRIITHSNGVITFTVNKSVPAGNSFNGILTVLKFSAKKSVTTSVSIQQM